MSKTKKPPSLIAQDTQQCTERPTQIRVAFSYLERNYYGNSLLSFLLYASMQMVMQLNSVVVVMLLDLVTLT